MAYTFKTNIANKSNYGSKRSTVNIKYIVIHFTANDGDTDENNGKYFKNNVVGASAHYFIDDDSVTQSVPDDYVAWSVGGSKYSNCSSTGGGKFYGKATNNNTLNIEICDDVKNGVIYPSQATIDNVIAFTKVKMNEYNIPASNVIRHFDVTGKSCPSYWTNNSKWQSEFWNKLNGTTSSTTTTTSNSSTDVPFSIKVDKVDKCDVLNIRKEPKANSEKTGELKYNDPNIYTIIEVKNGWGKLKSNVGWINLSYTKKVSKETSNTTDTVTKPVAPAPAPSPVTPQKVNVTYAVKVEGGKILPSVKNLEDYAGIENKKIIGLAMKVDKGSIKYQVHVVGGGWLPWVTGFNWNDHKNGYAGNGKAIDAIRVYYSTPSDLVKNGGYRGAKYHVSTIGNKNYYSWQIDDSKKNGMDGYAGAFGKAIDKVQITIE